MIDTCKQRIKQVLAEHPDGISAGDLCAELRRRGWAFDDLSPAKLGLDPSTIIRLADHGDRLVFRVAARESG